MEMKELESKIVYVIWATDYLSKSYRSETR